MPGLGGECTEENLKTALGQSLVGRKTGQSLPIEAKVDTGMVFKGVWNTSWLS